MTSLTRGHGYLNDCLATGTKGQNNIGAGDATQTILHGDILQIQGLCDTIDDEYVYIEYNFTDIDNIADIYTKWLCRWKTSSSSLALGAKVELYYTVGAQDLLESSGIPQFDTDWHLSSGTLDSGKVIDKIRFVASDYPDSVDSGTSQVYFDFCLLHKDTFVFPFISELEELELTNNVAFAGSPSRVGNIPQYMGAESPIIRLSGIMDTNTDWDDADSVKAGDLIRIWKEMHSDEWQWLTSDLINCKVIPLTLKISKVGGSRVQRVWDLVCRKYDLSSGDETIWNELSWLGL